MGKLTTDGLIFDVDGTLWNTVAPVAESWNLAFRDAGNPRPPVTAAEIQPLFGKTMTEIAEALLPGFPPERQQELLKLCIAYEDKAVAQLTASVLYPDVAATVKKIAARIPLFIVSNCQIGYVELFLEKSGLTPYFRDHECYGKTKLGKADNIKLLARRNGLRNPYYVGDTPMDAAACAAAGVPFVHAAYGFGQVENPAAAIHRFAELDGVF